MCTDEWRAKCDDHFLKDFIYLFFRERERTSRGSGRQREKQVPH